MFSFVSMTDVHDAVGVAVLGQATFFGLEPVGIPESEPASGPPDELLDEELLLDDELEELEELLLSSPDDELELLELCCA